MLKSAKTFGQNPVKTSPKLKRAILDVSCYKTLNSDYAKKKRTIILPTHLFFEQGKMKRIFIPTKTASDWQPLRAKPTLHWKKSYSAMTTAACWEATDGELPPEVKNTFRFSCQNKALQPLFSKGI
jgi:hypothetical protein